MSSSINKRAVTVGIFIFIGIVFFIVGVLTIGNMRKTFTKSVMIKTVFDDVEGLKIGNNVWFSGLKIGTVKKLDFYGKSQVLVTMNIDEKAESHIRKDSKAKIGSDGLIGSKIIVLYGGSDNVPQVESGDMLTVEKTTSMEDMMATLEKSNNNIHDITDDFKVITQQMREGQGTLGKLLQDESLYASLDATLISLRSASVNAQRLTASLSEFTNKLNEPGSFANELVTDTSTFPKLRSTIYHLDEVAASAKDVTNNLKAATNNLNDTNSPMGVLLHDQEGAKNLKETLKNLETSSKKLDEDLEAAQHSFLLRGYFKKKAKNSSQ